MSPTATERFVVTHDEGFQLISDLSPRWFRSGRATFVTGRLVELSPFYTEPPLSPHHSALPPIAAPVMLPSKTGHDDEMEEYS